MNIRTNRWLMIPVVIFILALNPVQAGNSKDLVGDEMAMDAAEFVEGEVLVGFQPGANAKAVGRIRKGLGGSAKKNFAQIRTRLWTLPKGLGVEKAIEILMKNPLVEYAEPNYILTADVQPDDPQMAELWAMHNIGQTGGLPDADIDAVEAWDITTDASKIVVGIIDTGIDYAHEDLWSNIWTNPDEIADNGLDDDDNGYIDDIYGWDFYNDDNDPFDDNGHGTHVAGTIGGIGNNGKGVAGVVWSVKLMALKFLSSGGSGTTDDAIDAVLYAASMGVPITNNSWSGGKRSKSLQNAIAASNSLFVASAGNRRTSRVQYPAGYPLDNILSVAATDINDEKSTYSNYGANWVDLGAPGDDILSSLPGDEYGAKSGTSMAAPHVTGVAALVMAEYPGLLPVEVKAYIMDAVDPLPALDGITVSGGRLNAYNAVYGGVEPPPVDEDVTPPGKVTDLAYIADSATHEALELTWTSTADDGYTLESGPAYFYDLRYSTDGAITNDTWDMAIQVDGEPTPQSPGVVESMLFTGLPGGTDLHFALKVADESGRFSGLSNNASAHTLTSPWQTGVVVDSRRVGFWNSLALPPDSDDPAIAYSEDDTGDVIFAKWNGFDWDREVASGDGRAGVSLAFNPLTRNPGISHGWGKLYFSRYDGGVWSTELVDGKGAKDDGTSLAYDSSGNPCIAYRGLLGKTSDLKIACHDGSQWEIQRVEADLGARYKSLAFDLNDNPVIAYSDDLDGDNRIDALKLAEWNGNSWHIETVDGGASGIGVFAALVIDPVSGNPMAVDRADGKVRFHHRDDGGVWNKFVIEDGSDSCSQPNIAIDSDGLPYVSYSCSSPQMMKVAHPVVLGSYDNWEIQNVDTIDVDWQTSIVIGNSGLPIVTYGGFEDFVDYLLKWAERVEP